MDERNVTIGQDALGNAIVTGSNNLTVVLFGVDQIPADLIDALKSGRMRPADAPRAVPLPALTLAIEFADEGRTQWRITARRATGDPSSRIAPTPWQSDVVFAPAFETFWRLSRTPAQKAEDADRLDAAAQRLGDALSDALTADEAAFLIEAARGDPPPPLLVIESNDDRLLALPWELIRLGDCFTVRDGRLDVARSVPATAAPGLSPPEAPMSLLVNVSAPEGSDLSYERKSYFILRALHEHVGVVINEMGEVDDLIEGLSRDPPPIGVHFSGHGGPGTLVFEGEYGEEKSVRIDDLITKIRQRAPARLPRFFFLACCHGGDAPQLGDGDLPAAATALHRDGITQVVGYFGPVLDELSTRAERAFYAELAAGRRTRDAVRAARLAMNNASVAAGRTVHRDAGAPAPGGTLPYGWAQMVLYQRGADYPLGTRITAGTSIAIERTERRTVEPYPGSRSQILKAGFVGRRKEMHTLRRDLRNSQHLYVVQGTGGLGKSAFCNEALKVYAHLGWQPLALWCADVEGMTEQVAGLVQQMEAVGRQLAPAVWEDVLTNAEHIAKAEHIAARREEVRQPAAHLLLLLRLLLEAHLPRLVVYLDNLETLQSSPTTHAPDAFADWRDAECAALWRGLRDLVRSHHGRLAVLASTRYRHRDFGAVVPFHRLPEDALWRMLAWFPSLRRLSEESRAGLVARLAGHPRAVEFLDALIDKAILSWEYDKGVPFEPGCLSAEKEQAEIIAKALLALDAELSEDLLFGALWDRVLDAPARDLLVRVGVLRRPGDAALLAALAGDDGKLATEKLRTTALLTEIREPNAAGGWTLSYEVHPIVRKLAERRSDRAEALREEGHRRAGEHLEQIAGTLRSPQDIREAAYHLRQVGEADRAYDLLAPLLLSLQQRGHILDLLAVLTEIGDPASLQPSRAAWLRTFQGDAAIAYGELPRALEAYRASLAIRERLVAADPSNATWQRDLSVSHNKICDVLIALGRHEDALKANDDALKSSEAILAITIERATADPRSAATDLYPAMRDWQCGFSFTKRGDVLMALGRYEVALKAYQFGFETLRDSLAIVQWMAAADPSSAATDLYSALRDHERDLSVSLDRIGDVLIAQSRFEVALKAYRASLAIREELAKADPSNATWQRDLSVSHQKIGFVAEQCGENDEARANYMLSRDILLRLVAQDASNAIGRNDLAWVDERLAALTSDG